MSRMCGSNQRWKWSAKASALAGASQPSAKARTQACAASVPAAAGVSELIAFSFLLMSLRMADLSTGADQRSRMKTVVATSAPSAAPARVWAGGVIAESNPRPGHQGDRGQGQKERRAECNDEDGDRAASGGGVDRDLPPQGYQHRGR